MHGPLPRAFYLLLTLVRPSSPPPCATLWYLDADHDGLGTSASAPMRACQAPAGRAARADDCDDRDPAIGAPRPWYADRDGDGHGAPGVVRTACAGAAGFVTTGDDCDDGRPEVYAPATWYADLDGDGWGQSALGVSACAPAGPWAAQGGDCDDLAIARHPGAAERCDAEDDDCDGLVDDGAVCAALPGERCVLDAHCADVDGGEVWCDGVCALRCDADRTLDLSGQGCSTCVPAEVRPRLEAAWDGLRPVMTNALRAISDGNWSALYDVEVYVAPLLLAADRCDDRGWLDELAGLVLAAQQELVPFNGRSAWLQPDGAEVGPLYQFQWTWLATRAMLAVAEVPPAERTPAMQGLLATADEIASIAWAWAFVEPKMSAHGWGCDGGAALVPTEAVTVTARVRTTDRDGVVFLNSGTQLTLMLEGGRVRADVITTDPDPVLGRPYTRHIAYGSRTVSDGASHDLAFVVDTAAGVGQIWVDGQRDGDVRLTHPMTSGQGSFPNIGGYNYDYGSCCFLSGTIDDVGFWDRELTPLELTTLSGCHDLASCPAGPVALWPLDVDGRDLLGRSALVDVTGAPAPGGGMTFDGVTTCARGHNYRLEQTWEWWMRGKRTGNLADSPDDPPYCHTLQDTDLWLLTTSAQLAALARGGVSVGLDAAQRARLEALVAENVALLQERTVRGPITDGGGRLAVGAMIEPDGYDTHEEHRHSAYEGETPPPAGLTAVAPAAGWDTCHNARVVPVFDSLLAVRDTLGLAWPDAGVVDELANQYAWANFNGDLAAPLFSNFVSGANGWYRWEYAGRPGFGYAPWDLSVCGYSSGYGLWGDRHADVDAITRAGWPVYTSQDPTWAAWRDAHYGRYWSAGARVGGLNLDPATSYDLLMYLPSFAR
jgi:hypothetical protein